MNSRHSSRPTSPVTRPPPPSLALQLYTASQPIDIPVTNSTYATRLGSGERQCAAELSLADALPSPYSLGPDALLGELDQLAASFSDAEWSKTLEELEKIDDVHALRHLVAEKERDLHLAARLGLAVAKKNQAIEHRLATYADFEADMQHRLDETARVNAEAQQQLAQEQRERHEEMQERFDIVTRVNTELRRELEVFREEFHTFRKDVTHINSRIDDMSTSMQDTNRQLTATNKRIFGLEGDMACNGETTQELQSQFESVVHSHRHQMSKTKQAVKDILRSHSRLAEELEQLRANVSHLSDRQQFSEERVSGLIDEYTALLTNAQNTILSLNEAHQEADMHSDYHSDGHLSNSSNSGLHAELSSAMARTESSRRRRVAYMRASRSQLDLRRPSIGLKDVLRIGRHDITGVDSKMGTVNGHIGSGNSIRVLHSYTLL